MAGLRLPFSDTLIGGTMTKETIKALEMRSMIIAIFLSIGAFGYAQEKNEAPVLTQEQYLTFMNKALDSIIEKCRKLPQQNLLFSANLFFAHEVCIKNMPLETLKKYVDALKEVGVHRIDINMGLFPWLDNHHETIQKYDTLIGHIRHHKLQLAINPSFNVGFHHKFSTFKEWTESALKVYPEIAARYKPDVFIVLHEPTTIAGRFSRSGIKISSNEWYEFVRKVARAVKKASPATRVGAGVLTYLPEEQQHFTKFLSFEEIEIVTMDIYTVKGLDRANKMISDAKKQGKSIYIEETWRPAYYTGKIEVESLDQISANGIGHADFQALDVKWLEAMSLYAGAWGLEAVTPFFTQTFFKYVKEDGNALAPDYNLKVIEAINKGERTKTFWAFKDIIQKKGISE